MQKSVYVIGSLRNKGITTVAGLIRAANYDVFEDWYAAGYEADDKWQQYEQDRGRTYAEALKGYSANHVFNYDRSHLLRCDIAVLALPAGKSGHLEFGWFLGHGKPGFVLFDDEPERWDVMYKFATGICFDIESLLREMEPFR